MTSPQPKVVNYAQKLQSWKELDHMNQNHVLDVSAEVLIGHIFLKGEAKFTAKDMEVASLLLKSVDLPQNVQDFLEIVVGSREGVDMYPECVAALTFPQK